MDGSGKVTVAGSFISLASFGGADLTSAGNSDVFVASYDASGGHRWSLRGGGGGWDESLAVAVDGSGNVTVTGRFWGVASFGGADLTSAGAADVFVASYDASGGHRWSRRFGATDSDEGTGAAVDGSGNVTITGVFVGTADFGGGDLTSAGDDDAFVVSLDASGAHRWSRRFGGAGSDEGRGVAADSSGNVTVTGRFADVVSFGGDDLTSAGGDDVFVASYDASGAHRWSRRVGGANSDIGLGVAVDDSGNVTVTGSFYGVASFGGGDLTSAGGFDVFVASYTVDGTHRWSVAYGGPVDDSGSGVATTGARVAVVGSFEDRIDFGTSALLGATGGFVAVLAGW